MKAICIKCGIAKEKPWQTCSNCGFTPEGEDLVQSTYCSVLRFTDDPDRETAYQNEIIQMSEAIQAGKRLTFDQAELQRLRDLIEFTEAGSPSVWGVLFRIFLPAIIFLAILYAILAWLEAMAR